MEKEVWKDVPEWESFYAVSNYGRVFSKRKNKIKPLDMNNYGYLRLLCYDGHRRKKLFVHRLVAELFVDGYRDGYVVDHIDGDKTNNMASNLEWVSRSENNRRAYNLGLNERKKKDTPCYLQFGDRKVYFETIVSAGRSIGVSDKRLAHLMKTQGGYIPEIDAYIFRCVSND